VKVGASATAAGAVAVGVVVVVGVGVNVLVTVTVPLSPERLPKVTTWPVGESHDPTVTAAVALGANTHW
jgi:hypothetical protein